MILNTFKLPTWDQTIVESEVENFDFVRRLSFSFFHYSVFTREKISFYTLESLSVLGEESVGNSFLAGGGFWFIPF